MNYGELKTSIIRELHRQRDPALVAQVPFFVSTAQEAISRRFNVALVPFVLDTDTDEVLTDFPSLYLLSAVARAYRFLNDSENEAFYQGDWQAACDAQNISGRLSVLDPYTSSAGEPPVIIPEVRL